MSKINMTGWIMKEHGVEESLLTVIEEDKNYKKEHNLSNTNVYWKCKCECGKIKTISGSDIRKGHTLSCGCLHKKVCSEKFLKDITNQRFGYLTAIKDSGKRINESVIWKCRYDCGNIVEIPIGNLTNSHTRSCGCKRNELASNNLIKNIDIGSKYGRLTVLCRDKHNYYEKIKWICKCDCGTIISVEGTKLRNGHTQSCGCLNSKGEELIKQILNENQITFEAQKRFQDCVSEKGNTLPFDFYIEKQFLLEFDGIQHFKSSSLFGGEKEYLIRQQHDRIKNDYCHKNNIPLKRIPYYALKELTLEDIMGDKYLIL